MNIKEIWKEHKEEIKQKKALKKLNKNNISKESKVSKILWILFCIFLTCFVIFKSCSTINFDDNYNWSEIVGVSDDTINELKVKANEDSILFDSKINSDDWIKTVTLLKNAGLSIFDENNVLDKDKLNKKINITKNFVLDSRNVGAFYNNCINVYNITTDFYVLNFKIKVNLKNENKFDVDSVYFVNLSQILNVKNLPSVYIKSKSKIQVLSNKISVLENNYHINNISTKAQNEIDKYLKNKYLGNIYKIGDRMLFDCINLFLSNYYLNIEILDNGLKFLK